MKSPNFSINVVLVGLSSVFKVCFGLVWFCFGFVGNQLVKMVKMPFLYNPEALRLGKGSFT